MRDVLLRTFAIALSIVLASSGIASAAGLTLHAAPEAVAASAGHDAHHHAAADTDRHGAVGHDRPARSNHGFAKCCSMCTVASALPTLVHQAVIVRISNVVFAAPCFAGTGRIVQVDPGIPKRIA